MASFAPKKIVTSAGERAAGGGVSGAGGRRSLTMATARALV